MFINDRCVKEFNAIYNYTNPQINKFTNIFSSQFSANNKKSFKI